MPCNAGYARRGKETSTYYTWRNMKNRCNNSNNKRYHDYGGRGIKACKRWLKFENFLADMGERPPGKTLDRIDNNKGYYKENCKWSTRKEQQRNMRNNRWITINNKTQCLMDWCKELNLKYNTIFTRLLRGWPVMEALEIVQRKR